MPTVRWMQADRARTPGPSIADLPSESMATVTEGTCPLPNSGQVQVLEQDRGRKGHAPRADSALRCLTAAETTMRPLFRRPTMNGLGWYPTGAGLHRHFRWIRQDLRA